MSDISKPHMATQDEKYLGIDRRGSHDIDTHIAEVDYYSTGEGIHITVGETQKEVRAVAVEVDDADESCETIRAYVLGTAVAVVGTGLNVWFGARQPGIYISPFLAQFFSHPVGVALAKFLPKRVFHLRGKTWSFNPGPWTVKEHAIVTMMATVSFPTATAIDIVIAVRQPIFFNDSDLGNSQGFRWLVVLSTQFLGLSLAGLSREYLVYPSNMTWPLNLAKLSLFNALHKRKVNEDGVVQVVEHHHGEDPEETDPPVNGWKISMFRFCLTATIASFVWFWFTSYIFPSLTYFNWPTWIAPNNKKLAIIMGSMTGLGLNPIPTFDWTYISGAGLTPLITPWWATLQTLIGSIIGLFVIIGTYWSNTWYSSYLLPNSNQAFDRFGAYYNVTAVLTPDKTLDVEAYHAYSPIYFGAGYNLVLIAYFASYSAVLTYAVLEHGSQLKHGIMTAFKNAISLVQRGRASEESHDRPQYDIHYAIMHKYKEVPQFWYLLILVFSVVTGIVMVEVYKTTMPVWGIFLCLLLAFVFLIPGGIIQALSNMQVSLVILAEIIPGVALPGRPYANMLFKLYGWVALVMALLYVQDQKLAHYLHIPPRSTFRTQIWGVLVSSIVSIGVMSWQFNAIPDLCEPGQKDLMTCPYYTTFYSSALMFGVVGPERMYGAHGLYKWTLFAFLAGAVATVAAFGIKKVWPNRYTKAVNVPVIIFGMMYFAPYNISYVWAGVPLAWFFMSHVYRRFPAWWAKYVYVMSIGATIGCAVSGVVIFFCVTYPGGVMPAWWGNTVYANGCDALGCPLLDLPDVGYFGPGRCDETKPACATCQRLGIECLGYGDKRPDWLREKANAREAKKQIKEVVMSHRFKKPKLDSTLAVEAHSATADESHDTSLPSADLRHSVLGNVPPNAIDGEESTRKRKRPRQPHVAQEQTGQSNIGSTSYLASSGDIVNGVSIPAEPDPYLTADSMTATLNPSLLNSEALNFPQASTSSLALTSSNFESLHNEEVDVFWSNLLESADSSLWENTGLVQTKLRTPSPTPFIYIPSPTTGPLPHDIGKMKYVHHYLNIVLPLQYRLLPISVSMSELVAPLALRASEVFESVSSLAALHMVSRRNTNRTDVTAADYASRLLVVHDAHERGPMGLGSISEIENEDALVAVSSHEKSMERLRFLSPQDLTTEETILCALFAISYHLFSGGTSKRLPEVVSINQRCLSAALSMSHEFADDAVSRVILPKKSPWSRYRPLIQHMIWIDIFASVNSGKGSRILPTYRRILRSLPTDIISGVSKPLLEMDRVMGCDSTTLLAFAEISALEEWKENNLRAGCLSYIELVDRAGQIRQLLDERTWREDLLQMPDQSRGKKGEDDGLRSVLRDIFFGAAKVLLAVAINGPFPRVPEVAQAVQDTSEALTRLNIEHSDPNMHRALVMPITIAGCHCQTAAQQAFFRSSFECLSVEAMAFGNTGSALELMKEVWRLRMVSKPDEAVCWRKTMVKLGWENGILLI
ncbi:OPT family small oligopeptide transporter [Cryptococcus amylolentus CBS 6039]|uniref:OPT family small oligopeptide transporter n=2 Tax=Cryptococcus amylolentus TaxID=104669 RepID=A0A1E3I2W6_9TREE|nr:OPT family small oligopeptide transporter [Cryptococcus amylolentus CBS 6039]ODN82201.1 OPT family small oligopeptide transporter [Cryptococcus amylolentus CBS 6039]